MKKTLLKTLLLTCLLSVWGANAHAATLEDVITHDVIGVSGTTYTDVTFYGPTSGVTYEGTTAGGNSAIQLRTSGSKEGFVSTVSCGKVTKIAIKWNSNTNNARVLNVYGSNTAYSASTDLYDSSAQGTLLVQFAFSAGDSEFTVTGDYEYIGIRSNDSALYLDEIDITWDGTALDIPEPEPEPTGHGYEPDDPYTASEALALAQNLDSSTTLSGVYVKGIISQIDEISTSYGNATYYISDDGSTTDHLEVYRGYYLNSASFTSEDQIKVGDEVIVYGDLVDYNGSTPELTSGNYIYSINGSTEAPEEEHDGEVDIEGTTVELINPDVLAGAVTTSVDFTTMGFENAYDVDGQSFTFTDGSTVTFSKGEGQTTPKYYTSGTAIRVYADNTMTFSCERAIAMIELHCYSTYEGNQSYEYVDFSEDGKTAIYCNLWTGTSGGTNLYVQSITITYAAEDGDQIDPQLAYSFTSVTCDTSNYGNAELPELTYAEEFDGVDEITYSSSNEEVAIVTEAGVVSILGVEGTASITASFPGNDTYFAETASFSITVEATHTFNFEVNNYGLTPISDSSTYDKEDVTLSGNDGVTLSLTVASGNGYRLWEGQDYNDLRLYNGVVMTITAPNPMTEISFYCESSYVSNMTSDVGEYSVVSTTGTWTGNATEVTFTMSGQMRIRTIDVTLSVETGTFSITSAGYATYYTDAEYTMPEGVTGTTVTGITEDSDEEDNADYILTMPWEYTEGSIVPARTALVLKGSEGTYTYTITSTEATAPTDNLLMGSTTETTTYGPEEGTSYVFYELSTGTYGVGFYYGATNGAAFTSGANKAWLPLTTTQAQNARFLGFGDGDDTTGISSVESASEKAVSGIYTIQGIRVSSMNHPGLYIVDGKKVLVK